MEDKEKIEKLTKLLEQQKLMLVEDLLKVRGNITIIERKLNDQRKMANEIEGRILQIEETLKFLKINNMKGPEK